MIKISKDNLFFWRYYFGILIPVMNIFFIIFIFIFNFWPVYLIYGYVAFNQFVIARVWRYLFIKDVYLGNDLNSIKFKNSDGILQEFECNQIIKCKNYYGITDVVIVNNDQKIKLYFMVNSKENLKYLSKS